MSGAEATERESGRQIQRARILDAMLRTVDELGYTRTTISGVCALARVSRGTFYELFDGLQDCFIAVLDAGYRHTHILISQAFERERYWLDGVRAALASLLALLDEEPRLARVSLIQALAAGSWALEHRGHHLAVLTATISERWPRAEGIEVNPLAARGVVESTLGIVQMRLLAGSEEPLLGLLGSLMGLVAAIYGGGDAARVEIERGEAHARAMLAMREPRPVREGTRESIEVPGALRDARAHRARECLYHLAENPGASNREIAKAVGIARQEQISKILARLNALGLLLKRAALPGGANAWSLTPLGMQVSHVLRIEYAPVRTASRAEDPGYS